MHIVTNNRYSTNFVIQNREGNKATHVMEVNINNNIDLNTSVKIDNGKLPNLCMDKNGQPNI